MSVDVHIIITGICALLTSGGLPTDVLLPANPPPAVHTSTKDHASNEHFAWLLFEKDALADPSLPMFERHKNDADDKFRFVRLDNEGIAFEPSPKDASIAVVDGIPSDRENPTEDPTTQSLISWVPDMHAIAPRFRVKSKVDLVAHMPVPGGTFSTNLVKRDCIWDFKPTPPRPYVQALAEEVDWNFTVPRKSLKIVLTKFDRSGSREIQLKDASWAYVTLGNTTHDDIVATGVRCDPKEIKDEHFELFYELSEPLTSRPIPHKKVTAGSPATPGVHRVFASEAGDRKEVEVMLDELSAKRRSAKAASSASAALKKDRTAAPLERKPPRRGAGSNCPPTRIESQLPSFE